MNGRNTVAAILNLLDLRSRIFVVTFSVATAKPPLDESVLPINTANLH